ncbi:2OG-Fe(II) oxygenase [Marinicella meishanensis]|uniref:2OG-Fe(II) oxygenase n=1 Tax=Marinicella meishanensis TaxID=2873263 RepID=UPI001CBE4E32|nr:2OG-Fe(II) oxygenase [Marinicella sp. NBU2979]
MINQLLNQQTIAQIEQLAQSFAAAKPFGHVVIDDFFAPEFCQQLLDQFPDFSERDAIDENQTVGKKAVVERVSQIGPAYRALDQLVQSEDFLQAIGHITGIDDLLYDPHYIGGGTHNNLHAQELDPHVDFTHHPITSDHRRLNLIVYLNHEWEASWGGNIEFHQDPRLPAAEDRVISVRPLFNRAVIFETHNHSWHGFPPIQLPADKQHLTRKSFALYYYTKKRPAGIEPHSTIYVERPLDQQFQAGHTLSAADAAALHTAVDRRDQHLARLYATITDQTKQISQLRAEVSTLKFLQGGPSKQEKDLLRKMELLSFDETRLLNRIQELENSTSWRITAPLRQLKRWLKR